jgi:hypothetical protein
LIRDILARGGLWRRIVTRAVVVVGVLWVGGLMMRSFPHDQVLVFPVGSVFPNATRFSASWKQPGEREARGGVTLTFTTPPPLRIRHHAELPNGDYLVSIEVVSDFDPALSGKSKPTAPDDHADRPENSAKKPESPELSPAARGVQTNIERRVTLGGGETLVALVTGGF